MATHGKNILLETEECIGCESCVEICPDMFEFDEEHGVAKVRTEMSANEDIVQEAIDSCPAEAISIVAM
jgi:ferredoxin